MSRSTEGIDSGWTESLIFAMHLPSSERGRRTIRGGYEDTIFNDIISAASKPLYPNHTDRTGGIRHTIYILVLVCMGCGTLLSVTDMTEITMTLG